MSARRWSYFESSEGQSTRSMLTNRSLSRPILYFVASLRGPWIAEIVSGWCFLYGIFLYENNHIELEDLRSVRNTTVWTRESDSQRVIQHAKQRVNICRGVRNRDHRHALILFAPPDTDVAPRFEHVRKND